MEILGEEKKERRGMCWNFQTSSSYYIIFIFVISI